MKFTKSYEPGAFEPQIYAEWEHSGAFNPPKVIDTDESDTQNSYSLVMPPPNANGNLHIGHGLTIALEDSLARYNRLRGKNTWYVPGADHAGFETWVVYERALEKEGHTRFEYSRDELYARVWDFVEQQRGNMELQLRALGASCAWDDLTFTLDENVVSRVYKTFEKMWDDGMIYRGEKLVNFCPHHQTAFADIEVEHQDEAGHLWDIAYPVVSIPDDMIDSSSDFLKKEIIVSTTRPETLFGDTAVAVNPNDPRYQNLIGGFVKLPLTDREIPIIADEHADPEYGTGAVKITPAHDFDDFEVGERHNLERISVIAENGTMNDNVPEAYRGLSTLEARKKVLSDLEAAGLMRGTKDITHSVAHCYKCGAVIEPMLKSQWFIDVKRLAKTAITHLENGEIKFHPASKKKVLINYLEGLKDWNISRQIPWGIAIPMFRQTETDKVPEWIFDTRTNLQKIEVGGVTYYRDEDTFDTWFSSSHWPIVCTNWTEDGFHDDRDNSDLRDGIEESLRETVSRTCPDGNPSFGKQSTAGSSIAGRPNPYYPLNVMETGADILFAWVARMIMMGLYVTGEVPFREVYLHGLVLDAHGQKMSKSKGNVINPMDMVTKYGSDAFRLGILRGRSAGMNQAFSENSVISGRNLCNKLWNISRFIQSLVDESHTDSPIAIEILNQELSANIVNEGQVAAGEQSPYSTDHLGEDWICRELTSCKEAVEDDFEHYRFSEAVETLYSTIWDKYADWFLESQKIYKNLPLLKVTLEMILKMLHPFAPFVTEAIWQSLSWTDGLLVTSKWPARLKYDEISAAQFDNLTTVVTEVRTLLQELPAKKGEKWNLLYGDDSLVDDNQLLTAKLSGVGSVISCEGQPRGLRLALVGHELYLDVPADVVSKYQSGLEDRILSVGRELDTLNARMLNPNYVDKAPAELVKQTRDQIAEKTALLDRLKQELSVIR